MRSHTVAQICSKVRLSMLDGQGMDRQVTQGNQSRTAWSWAAGA